VKKQVCKTVIVDDGLPDNEKSDDAKNEKAKLVKEVTNDDEKDGGYRDEDGKKVDMKKLTK